MDYMCCAVPVRSLRLTEQMYSTDGIGIHADSFESMAPHGPGSPTLDQDPWPTRRCDGSRPALQFRAALGDPGRLPARRVPTTRGCPIMTPADPPGDRYVSLEASSGAWRGYTTAHPRATIFHHPAWTDLLAEQYGFETRAACIYRDGAIVAGLPYCVVASPFRARRWVSLPFSDRNLASRLRRCRPTRRCCWNICSAARPKRSAGWKCARHRCTLPACGRARRIGCTRPGSTCRRTR